MSTVTYHSAAALCAAFALLAPGSAPICASGASEQEEEELEGRAPTAIELEPSVEAAFQRESYAPGETATLVVRRETKPIRIEALPRRPGTGDDARQQRDAGCCGHAGDATIDDGPVHVDMGNWPSGLYFARLEAARGRIGFAPFVVRPRKLGASRVAVVLPTLTWQAYNLRDDDRDGKPDSWYGDWTRHSIRVGRPFLNRGVPYHFRRYDLPFLHWLARSGREVDVLTDEDLDEVAERHRARRRV